jgi:hypothetical protein
MGLTEQDIDNANHIFASTPATTRAEAVSLALSLMRFMDRGSLQNMLAALHYGIAEAEHELDELHKIRDRIEDSLAALDDAAMRQAAAGEQ